MSVFQNVPKLCSLVAECVAAFSIDFWLQTNLFQCGVLWHLLLFLFNYDYTLEEGGVEKSDQTNQQVKLIFSEKNALEVYKVNLLIFSNLSHLAELYHTLTPAAIAHLR